MSTRVRSIVTSATLIALLSLASAAAAQTAPSLGAAQSFAVLAGSTVTNTGADIITGDLGVSPGSAVTGFPPGVVVSGTIHSADAAAAAAQNSITAAYNNLAGQACNQDLSGQDLGGKTLTPGVHCFSTSAQLTGTLTLDAQGSPNAVFIFKIGSTLTVASGANVVMINNGSLCNVFWQVGSSATIGTGAAFAGSILAQASVTFTTGSTQTGRVFARTGAVTLDTSSISGTCLTGPVPPPCGSITLSPASLPSGTVNAAYAQTILASGGTAPYTFVVSNGTLPPGLTLTPAGVLAGTPTTAGSSTVTIRGTDTNGCTGTAIYTILIAAAPAPPPACPVIAIAPPVLPGGTVGIAYSQTLVGSGGAAPYTFGVSVGTLPTGLTLTSSGVLSGTPLVASTTPLTVRATDANGCTATLAYSLNVVAAPAPPPACPVLPILPLILPGGVVGTPFSQTISASGGTAPYSFGVTVGSLPAGLVLSPTGVLSGTPTVSGTTGFTVHVTAANGCIADMAFTMIISTPVPTLPTTVMILFAMCLAGMGYMRLRQRVRA